MAKMEIQVQCEGCGTFVSYPSEELGTLHQCPACEGYLDDNPVDQAARHNRLFEEQMEMSAKVLSKQQQLCEQSEQILARVSLLLDRWAQVIDAIDLRTRQ